jgi:hypothetical protein
MLGSDVPIVLLQHGGLDNLSGKTGLAMLRYRRGPIVAVVDPAHAGADLRQDVGALLLSGDGNAGQGPRRGHHAQDVRDDGGDASTLFRVDVGDHRSAVLPVELVWRHD